MAARQEGDPHTTHRVVLACSKATNIIMNSILNIIIIIITIIIIIIIIIISIIINIDNARGPASSLCPLSSS